MSSLAIEALEAIAGGDGDPQVIAQQTLDRIGEGPQMIVAEVSKTWPNQEKTPLISVQLEEIIEVNIHRGYSLDSWHYSVAIYNGEMNETIIAIFRKCER